MHNIKLSKKLVSYLEKVKAKTRRDVQIEFGEEVGLSGMSAAFKVHPTHILILIASRSEAIDPQIEQSIAHEATHGLLLYGKGYTTLAPKRPCTDSERKSISILLTMIDDIVVNKILQLEGFSPFGFRYLDTVTKETKTARKGGDYYGQYSDDPLFKSRFMVFRYVLAWGFLEYYDLGPQARRLIRKFLKSFRKAYPRQYEMATRVTQVIANYDVFTVEGHRKILQEILVLWSLNDAAGT